MSASQKLLEYVETAADEEPVFAIREIQSLLGKGADHNYVNKETGETVCHKMAVHWDRDKASLLYKHLMQFSKKSLDTNVLDKYGKTPLHEATRADNTDMVEWLLKHGAKLDMKTLREHQTPLHYAARFDSINSMEILQEEEGNFALEHNR